jgi:hypothetical protein
LYSLFIIQSADPAQSLCSSLPLKPSKCFSRQRAELVIIPLKQAEYVRGSCADKEWRSSKCPSFCVNPANNDKLDGGIGMKKCPGRTDNTYYYDDGADFYCQKQLENVLSFQGSKAILQCPVRVLTLNQSQRPGAGVSKELMYIFAREPAIFYSLAPNPLRVTWANLQARASAISQAEPAAAPPPRSAPGEFVSETPI